LCEPFARIAELARESQLRADARSDRTPVDSWLWSTAAESYAAAIIDRSAADWRELLRLPHATAGCGRQDASRTPDARSDRASVSSGTLCGIYRSAAGCDCKRSLKRRLAELSKMCENHPTG